jgi:hypothetical protein
MKNQAYKNLNSSATIDVNSVHPPFKVKQGKIMYVEAKTGIFLSENFETAKVMQWLINELRSQPNFNFKQV